MLEFDERGQKVSGCHIFADISGMLVHSMLKSTNIAQRVISGNEGKAGAATKQNGGKKKPGFP